MPRGDGTGPAGMGPMTGRAKGYCAGYPAPGFVNPGWGGRFWGRGRGGGFGWRNRFFATGLTGWQREAAGWPAWGGVPPYAGTFVPAMSREEQIDALKEQAKYFEDALSEIRKRMDELAGGSGKD
ncbi:MAG: hypothetical protein A4E73_03819 [Syntrophaceae bacterium PtaU1.Bin231]|nr:MAG: hypothetical protein A4E73_03819 [Syntrophaceae bacterium PtaU1.Bin231]